MSGIAKEDEIDKVVSSVRKLVSRAPIEGEDSSDNADETDKPLLLLTPSLRVDEAEGDEIPPPNGENVVTLDLALDGTAAEPDPTLAALQAATRDQSQEPDTLDTSVWASRRPENELIAADDYSQDTDTVAPEVSSDDALDTVDPEDVIQTESGKDTEEQGEADQSDDSLIDDPDEQPSEEPEPLLTSGDDKEDDLGAFFSAEAALDRELLRQMVLDIVREELRGDMGHKITGSVRKLVRREINRILENRELD